MAAGRRAGRVTAGGTVQTPDHPVIAAPADTEPVPPERNGIIMNHSHATEQQRRAEELVSWTCGERIRFLWYRFRLTVQEIIYANGRLIELHMGLTSPDSAPRTGRPAVWLP